MRRQRIVFAVIGMVFALAILLTMSSCNLFGTGTLTLRNYSTRDIDFVTWTSDDGTVYDFGDDLVYDDVAGWVYGIAVLGMDSRQVSFGSNYIYFFFTDSIQYYRTAAAVDVGLFTDGEFTFYDTTFIYTATLQGGSTTTQVYSIVPVPGSKPTK